MNSLILVLLLTFVTKIELDFNEPITAKFPDNYTDVLADAFKDCKYIPENVDFNNIETIADGERGIGILSTSITNRVFNDIKLKNVRNVGAYAFWNAHIKNIYFGGNLESAGSSAVDGGTIDDVYYEGSESSWNNLGITGSAFSQSTFHFNYEF